MVSQPSGNKQVELISIETEKLYFTIKGKFNQTNFTYPEEVYKDSFLFSCYPEDDVIDVNLYSEKNLGGGFSYNPKIISPNQEGRYSIEYILGSIEEVPEMKLPPTQEQLYELLENARNTTLVIHYQKKN